MWWCDPKSKQRNIIRMPNNSEVGLGLGSSGNSEGSVFRSVVKWVRFAGLTVLTTRVSLNNYQFPAVCIQYAVIRRSNDSWSVKGMLRGADVLGILFNSWPALSTLPAMMRCWIGIVGVSQLPPESPRQTIRAFQGGQQFEEGGPPLGPVLGPNKLARKLARESLLEVASFAGGGLAGNASRAQSNPQWSGHQVHATRSLLLSLVCWASKTGAEGGAAPGFRRNYCPNFRWCYPFNF